MGAVGPSGGGRSGTDPVLDSSLVGAWRSLVAHQSGGLVVVGSNPAAPTISLYQMTGPRAGFVFP